MGLDQINSILESGSDPKLLGSQTSSKTSIILSYFKSFNYSSFLTIIDPVKATPFKEI